MSNVVEDKLNSKIRLMSKLLNEVQWCSDEVFSKSEKSVLQTIKLIQQEPLLQKIFGWDKGPCYIKKRPEEKDIACVKKYKRNLGRERAIDYCRDIHEKLHSIGGIFIGEDTNFRFWVVMKVWVFGSVAKGKINANDLDILYNYEPVSIRTDFCNDDIEEQFLNYILKGKRQTALMDYDSHNCLADGKIEIYPKFKLK